MIPTRLMPMGAGGKRLPYDAEVEYLESTGTQYVDTGCVANSDLGLSMDCELSQGVAGNIHAPGALQRQPELLRHHLSRSNGYWQYYLGPNSAFFARTNVSGRMTVIVDTMSRTVSIGATTDSWSAVPAFTTGLNYWLFRRIDSDATQPEFPFVGRLYTAKIYVSGVLVRDFIPVRVGTTGYLYDRVSGELFGNQGTGAFVVGPDK